ncbi:MAG: ATP-dependent RNA helicase RhlB [Desulfobacterales bacterium]|nr:ATP-dependent RNA helicase RhlB [Desulfobacterales bacterium]MBS3756041.1 ATP-dependent RNA helicase RhlB [Desulfobacterales bacterium]
MHPSTTERSEKRQFMKKHQLMARTHSGDSKRATDSLSAAGAGSHSKTSSNTEQQMSDATHSETEQWNVSEFQVSPAAGRTRFHDFDLPDPIMRAISDLEFEYCTPIQAEIMPASLAGKDASGRAQTGTGKTAAFLISLMTRILQNPAEKKRKKGTPRVLILAPTRELVLQITDEARQLADYTKIRIVPVFGGMDYVKQQNQLGSDPLDIVVATPGRLLDFHRKHVVTLNQIEALVIDEADRMLDMGFIPDVRKIIRSTPPKGQRQTLLFSATLTQEIMRLSEQWTKEPVTVEIEPEQVAVDTVEQIVYIVTMEEKFGLLYNIIEKKELDRVLIFCNRKDEVRRLTQTLSRYGINCDMISGDVDQKKRMSRLNAFKTGKIRVLVATDVAGRGIHIEGMNHVINFTLPHDPEDYVHRIGRTGRAGELGTSISFADEDDAFYIPAIEQYLGRKLDCIEPPEQWRIMPEAPPRKKGDDPEDIASRPPRKKRSSGGGNRRRKRN